MRTRRRRLVYATVLAGVLHADLLLLIGLLVRFTAPTAAELRRRSEREEEAISLDTIDEEIARQILADLDREEEKAREEEVRKEQEALEAPGQVVELPPPREPSERPRDARYVSEHDSSVDKETKREGRFGAAPAAPPAPPGALALRPPEPAARARGAAPPRSRPAAAGAAAPGPEPPRPLDEAGALSRARPEAAAPEERPAPEAVPRAPGGPQQPLSLLPTAHQMADAVGGGTQDHLPDVDEGADTSLNAKSWRFASFFNRVKRQVAEHWRPASEYERRDPTGRIYGTGQWVTYLRIVLKPDGALDSVAVQQASGLDFLDDVAVEAVKRAQPYPNPPAQLVDPRSGLISFRFGFFFDVGSGPRMKVYRYGRL